jgi:hypothetical protein
VIKQAHDNVYVPLACGATVISFEAAFTKISNRSDLTHTQTLKIMILFQYNRQNIVEVNKTNCENGSRDSVEDVRVAMLSEAVDDKLATSN